MLSSSWRRNSKCSAPAARRHTQTSPGQRASRQPRLEALEYRCLFSTLTVTSLADSGAGSLRATITAAASGDTIVFSSSLFSSGTAPSSPLVSSSLKGNGSGKGNGKGHGKPVSPPPPPPTPNTITLTSGPLALAKNLTIQGPGTTPLTITSTAIYASNIFGVAQSATVTLSGITISKGFSYSGGGIYNSGALTLDSCTVSGCSALYYGGGIYNVGTLSINNSTLSGNSARFGGAIYNAGMVTIDGSTISGNYAFHSDYPWSGGDGGGIYNAANGTVTVRNSSSIAGNTSDWLVGGVGPDVYNLGTIYRDGTSTIGGLHGNAAVLI